MQLWQLQAREAVRDTLARYTWAGDGGRVDELAATFTADGVLEIRGRQPVRGRAAIAEMLAGVAAVPPRAGVRRIVRHNLANTRFTELTPQRAGVSSYFTVFTEIGLDHHGRYRDVFVPDGEQWLIAHRFVSTDWSAPDSTMAPPSVHRSG